MASREPDIFVRSIKDDPDGENGGDSYEVDQSTLRRYDLPSSFNNGYQVPFSDSGVAFTRKKEKQCFVCDLCEITELNSIDTKRSHEKGAKHQMALMKHKERLMAAGNFDIDDSQIPGIRAVAPQKPTEKKQPVRLAERLRETRSMMVGLNYILEIIACSSEEEPHYECQLCGLQGIANGMYNHLAGKQHKQKFLAKVDPTNPKVKELSPSELEQKLKRHATDDYTEINTVYSDEMYPWDAGKAPWSLQQGGTGQPPTNARNNINIMKQKISSKIPVDSKEGVLSNGPLSLSQVLEYANNLKHLTADDVQMAYSLALKLVELASSNQTHGENDQAFEMAISNVKMFIQTLKTINHKDQVHEEDDFSYKDTWSRAGPSWHDRGDRSRSHSQNKDYQHDRRDRWYARRWP